MHICVYTHVYTHVCVHVYVRVYTPPFFLALVGFRAHAPLAGPCPSEPGCRFLFPGQSPAPSREPGLGPGAGFSVPGLRTGRRRAPSSGEAWGGPAGVGNARGRGAGVGLEARPAGVRSDGPTIRSALPSPRPGRPDPPLLARSGALPPRPAPPSYPRAPPRPPRAPLVGGEGRRAPAPASGHWRSRAPECRSRGLGRLVRQAARSGTARPDPTRPAPLGSRRGKAGRREAGGGPGRPAGRPAGRGTRDAGVRPPR